MYENIILSFNTYQVSVIPDRQEKYYYFFIFKKAPLNLYLGEKLS